MSDRDAIVKQVIFRAAFTLSCDLSFHILLTLATCVRLMFVDFMFILLDFCKIERKWLTSAGF